jgi:hypothetical protein
MAMRLRIVPAVSFAGVAAAVIAWALRDNARFLPYKVVQRQALVQSSHGHSDFVPPAPVTGAPLVNYTGLVMLALHLVVAGVLLAAWLVRRVFRLEPSGVRARLSFAVMISVAAALVTIPVAAVSLGSAILFTATLAAAMTVLQYTFVLGIVGAVIFGVP